MCGCANPVLVRRFHPDFGDYRDCTNHSVFGYKSVIYSPSKFFTLFSLPKTLLHWLFATQNGIVLSGFREPCYCNKMFILCVHLESFPLVGFRQLIHAAPGGAVDNQDGSLKSLIPSHPVEVLLYYILLYFIILYYTELHSIVLHCTVKYHEDFCIQKCYSSDKKKMGKLSTF